MTIPPTTLAPDPNAVAQYLAASSPGNVKFVQAKNFTSAQRTIIRWVVIHATDGAEGITKAEDAAARFAGVRTEAPRASAHYTVDTDSVVQCVKDQDIAWHAPGANKIGLGIELCGRVKQTPADWIDALSLPELYIGAGLTARLCKRFDIPATFVGHAELLQGLPGITTHYEVNQAFHGSTHTDPGPGFPREWFLEQVCTALALV